VSKNRVVSLNNGEAAQNEGRKLPISNTNLGGISLFKKLKGTNYENKN
jgi:hypothetical protein